MDTPPLYSSQSAAGQYDVSMQAESYSQHLSGQHNCNKTKIKVK